MGGGAITRNAARCLKCGETIESKGRHDFRWCSCHAIFVDGGLDYLRRGGDLDAIEELSEYAVPIGESAHNTNAGTSAEYETDLPADRATATEGT